MMKEEIWSISLPRACDFFRRQKDVAEDASYSFRFRCCRITLAEASPGSVGPWTVPRCRIRVEGDDEDAETIYHRFFKQFLSAGG